MFYAALIALTSVLDLALKSGVEAQPDTAYPRDVKGTGGLVQVRKLHNEGFPMGIMKEKPELVRCLPLAVASSLLLRLSCLLPKKGNHLEKAGLAFMIGGACSNLFDRFFRAMSWTIFILIRNPPAKSSSTLEMFLSPAALYWRVFQVCSAR